MRTILLYWLMFTVLGVAKGQEAPRKSKGAFSGEWRTYYLSTHNKGPLKDFYALATGGKLKYVHSWGGHIKLGGALYTSYNAGLQDLTVPDAVTGKGSRYEVGLFDVQDVTSRLIVIPGELFFQYLSQKHELTLGRMKIATPLINPADGRMIPTLEQGLWYHYKPGKKYQVQLGFINAIAPRSTAGFFGIGESIGKYPVGRSHDGSASQYAGNTKSDFVLVTNLNMAPAKTFKLAIWDYYVDQVFHTLYLKPTLTFPQKTGEIALEWLHQDRLGNGGNDADSLRYFSDAHANVLGAQVSVNLNKTKLSLGYNHILSEGRFLFPREWGREPLFSFQKRERSEGAAGNHAVLLTYERTFAWQKNQLQTITSLGHHWKPTVLDPASNKYGLPDYTHINLDFYYHAEKVPKLKPELLLTYKIGNGDFPENPNFVINKIDMFQVNFILNYNF